MSKLSPIFVQGNYDSAYYLDEVGNRYEVVGGDMPGFYTMDDSRPNPDDRRANQYTLTEFGGARQYDRAGRLASEDFKEIMGPGRWLFYDWTGRLSWNQHGQLIGRHFSDPVGRPIKESVWMEGNDGDPARVFRIHSGAQEIEERDETGLHVLGSFVHGANIDEVIESERNGVRQFHHTDDLGNALCLTDDSGEVVERYDYGDFGWPHFYAPDGTPRGISAPGIENPFLFNGRRWDPLAEQYDYRTRRLDPRAGRFTSRDLIGTWGDPGNLGNQYSYVGNNPWTHTDPLGLFTMDDWYFNDMYDIYPDPPVAVPTPPRIADPQPDGSKPKVVLYSDFSPDGLFPNQTSLFQKWDQALRERGFDVTHAKSQDEFHDAKKAKACGFVSINHGSRIESGGAFVDDLAQMRPDGGFGFLVLDSCLSDIFLNGPVGPDKIWGIDDWISPDGFVGTKWYYGTNVFDGHLDQWKNWHDDKEGRKVDSSLF